MRKLVWLPKPELKAASHPTAPQKKNKNYKNDRFILHTFPLAWGLLGANEEAGDKKSRRDRISRKKAESPFRKEKSREGAPMSLN